MRLKKRFAVIALVGALGLLQSNAPARAVSKVAASGATILLYQMSSTNPDCSSAGQPLVRIIQSPEHGRLTIRNTRVFPLFSPNNLRSACNRTRVPGIQLHYTSQRGYTGYDAAAIDIFFPSGQNRQASFDITVR